MIRAEDLARFADTTMQIAGGDVHAQLAAWGIDEDGFWGHASVYANTMSARYGGDPRVYVIAWFCGFELGYRSAVEVGAAGAAVPDVIDFDETDRRYD